ncbi:MAG: cysteine desulfurase family protein [Sorangiineae bacterium]|nr:cysteine desulfurase family protein [Sorangiineae bacterium]
MSGPRVYLDWNATTPPLPEVCAAMRAALEACWANPSSIHADGRRARAVIEDTREALAALIEAHPRDVLFTSGGTEANNLALHDALGLALSRLEHPSIIRVAERLAAEGRPVVWLPVAESGMIELDAWPELLGGLPPGSRVALMAANHETGVIQPIARAAALAHAAGLRLHVDAVQALGKLPASSWQGADTVSVAAHKLRGPKGIGALAWRGPPAPRPLLVGGAQERGLRPGTLDPIAAAGFGAAAARAKDGPARYAALEPLRARLAGALAEHGEENGAAPRLPHVASFSCPGWRGDELVAALDLLGVSVSSGSACSAGTSEASPVIRAMLGEERARSAVRASLGDATTASEVERAIHAFRRALTRRSSSS